MRCEREPANQDAETIGYTFHFQISSNGGRQACSIKVQARNVHEATTFFRQNWPMIETMARDRLIKSSCDDWTLSCPRSQLGDAACFQAAL
jgi:hypothetical protein